ncbi:MAG: regulatory protein ArsR [Cenarchaeum symbiont of Oopsacas minuta]|nr:regulatory protein ArsR [Cenarchaeum symbiont of Oopsacas minuta]
MEMQEGMETKRNGLLLSQAKRVKMIFSVMASPNRIDILRILNSKGPLTYSELKSLAGFKSKKESGKFAYHLRKLLRQSLVALNKSERRYTITNLGQLVLSLARQIEERSVIESGKMYVRTSHESIEEFASHKITQSLAKEGGLPENLAQKISEEVENRIYKYQPSYLTGSLIREMVNAVLMEHGHEEYRNKLARLGMPVYDIADTFSNIEKVDSGIDSLVSKTGCTVFSEFLLAEKLPKDIADSHLSGDLHITNTGLWSLLPDTIFTNIKELADDGLDLGGKLLNVSRLCPIKTIDGMASTLSMIISLVSREASQEVVLDGLVQLVSKYSKNAELEEKIASAFSTASASLQQGKNSGIVTIHLALGSNTKIIRSIISAYVEYVKITPMPKLGLTIDTDAGSLSDISAGLAEAISFGGRISIGKGSFSTRGIANRAPKGSELPAQKLESISINLPRLAFEANKDETYFRARLAMLVTPAFAAMAQRKKDVSDMTRRGLNPIMAKSTQYMQRGSTTLVLNIVGLREAVYNILSAGNEKKYQNTIYKVIETAIDRAKKEGKALGENIHISMTENSGTSRFFALDAEKYGKNSAIKDLNDESYLEGIVFDGSKADEYTAKSEEIIQCNRMYKLLNGGMLISLQISKKDNAASIKNTIEKMSTLLPFFRSEKPVPMCGECGYKDADLESKCPRCKSPYIV